MAITFSVRFMDARHTQRARERERREYHGIFVCVRTVAADVRAVYVLVCIQNQNLLSNTRKQHPNMPVCFAYTAQAESKTYTHRQSYTHTETRSQAGRQQSMQWVDNFLSLSENSQTVYEFSSKENRTQSPIPFVCSLNTCSCAYDECVWATFFAWHFFFFFFFVGVFILTPLICFSMNAEHIWLYVCECVYGAVPCCVFCW